MAESEAPLFVCVHTHTLFSELSGWRSRDRLVGRSVRILQHYKPRYSCHYLALQVRPVFIPDLFYLHKFKVTTISLVAPVVLPLFLILYPVVATTPTERSWTTHTTPPVLLNPHPDLVLHFTEESGQWCLSDLVHTTLPPTTTGFPVGFHLYPVLIHDGVCVDLILGLRIDSGSAVAVFVVFLLFLLQTNALIVLFTPPRYHDCVFFV